MSLLCIHIRDKNLVRYLRLLLGYIYPCKSLTMPSSKNRPPQPKCMWYTGKLLDGLARGDKPAAERRLKPGTVLVREYQGDRHPVTGVPGGYVWRDATYASLSAIACNITGTAWNGPRFFGLRASGNCPDVIAGEPAESHAGIATDGRLHRSSVSPPRTKVRR